MINLIGIILPVLIDFINGKMTNKFARFMTSVGICALFGTFVAFVETNGFRSYVLIQDYVETIAKAILVMFGIAQLTYQGFYRDTDLHDDVRGKALPLG